MAEVILQAKHLGISFGGLKAVDDFNIEIKAGTEKIHRSREAL